jgi:hypothetical protein
MATETKRTHPVRVRIREVPYAKLLENALGQPYIDYVSGFGPGRPEIRPDARTDDVSEEDAQKDFKLGQLIYLLDDDYLRLKNAGAVKDAEDVEQQAVEMEDEVLDVETASVDDLARWIVQEKPTVNEVVQASDGQPELAEKLLRAEAQAAQETNGEPRKTVVDGLSTVMSRG